MPPIIEDYAAIKRRMEEMNRPTRKVVIPVLEGYAVDEYGIGKPVFGQRIIDPLTPEGRKLMEGK